MVTKKEREMQQKANHEKYMEFLKNEIEAMLQFDDRLYTCVFVEGDKVVVSLDEGTLINSGRIAPEL